MWNTILDLVFLAFLIWLGAATLVAGVRYRFRPYFVSAIGCGIAALGLLGVLLLPELSGARLFRLAQSIGIFTNAIGLLLVNSEERRRGVKLPNVILFRRPSASPSSTSDEAKLK